MNNSPALTQTPAQTPGRSIGRSPILDFARRMTEHGSVVVAAHGVACDPEQRLAVHDVDSPGYSVVFVGAVDGSPEVSTMNFDFGPAASRHLVHGDGLGMTLCAVDGRPAVTYRIPA